MKVILVGWGTEPNVDIKEAYTAHEWQEYRLSGRVGHSLSRISKKNKRMKGMSYSQVAIIQPQQSITV